MTKSPESTEATQAVAEASRTISEVARDNVTYAQRALSSTRAYLSDAPKLIQDGAVDVEALTRAVFGLQNAVLTSVPPVVEAAFGASKSVFAAYTTLAEQQQKIVLGAWKRTIDLAQQSTPTPR